jgi:hypothetical protein
MQLILEESDHDYSASDLASCIIMLYHSGIRDHAYFCELSARLALQRFQRRHEIRDTSAANTSGLEHGPPPAEYDPFA